MILDSTWVVIDPQGSLLTICSKCIGGPCQAKVRLSRHISWKEFDCNAQSNFMTSNSRCKAPFFNDTDPGGPVLISWNGREKFGKGSVWWHRRTHTTCNFRSYNITCMILYISTTFLTYPFHKACKQSPPVKADSYHFILHQQVALCNIIIASVRPTIP